MENYIITLKFSGRIDFSEDPEQAMTEAQVTLLPYIKQHQFQILTISPFQVSERSTHSDYSSDLFEECCILEVKLGLEETDLKNDAAIYERLIADVERGKYIVERIDENQGPDVLQSIVTLSEKDRHRHYLVDFKSSGQLESIDSNNDEAIVKEVIMLLQSGDVQLLNYEITHEREIDNHCDSDDTDITENHTIFEIRLVVNEFNVDFHDLETFYYYVLGQLSHCESAVSYKYVCGEEPNIKTVIGIDIHCHIQTVEFDDIDDLFEQL